MVDVNTVQVDSCGRDGWYLAKNCSIDEFTKIEKGLPKNDTISDCIKNFFVVDGKAILDIFVISEDLVDVIGEGVAFCISDSMVDSFFHSKLKIF
jgi:hypothetical protein